MTVVRPLAADLMTSDDFADESLARSVWPFFVSYYFVSSIVLFNIIVAILLDEFINATAADKFQRRATTMNTNMALDWVLTVLAGFSTPSEFHRSVQTLFRLCDNEDQNYLSFQDLCDGLRRICPPEKDGHVLELTLDDWEHITEDGRLCNAQGNLDLDGFEVMLRRQLCIFSLRRAATSVKDAEPSVQSALLLLKMILMLVESEKEADEDEQIDDWGVGALTRSTARLRDDNSAHSSFTKRKSTTQNETQCRPDSALPSRFRMRRWKSAASALGGEPRKEEGGGGGEGTAGAVNDNESHAEEGATGERGKGGGVESGEGEGGASKGGVLDGISLDFLSREGAGLNDWEVNGRVSGAQNRQRHMRVALECEEGTGRELRELLERERERDRLLAELVERDRERDRRDATTHKLLQQVLAIVQGASGGVGGEPKIAAAGEDVEISERYLGSGSC